jgi:hypothetical protein
MKTQLHFIVGIGRSGTTILSNLLNKYEDVQCLPEANFFVFFLNKFRGMNKITKKEIDLVFEEIEIYSLSHPLVGYDFKINDVKQKICNKINENDSISYNHLCLLIYNEFRTLGVDKKNAHILIDKNPSYSIFINNISKEMPDAKFIWIVRDYRANILSRKQSIYLKSPDVAYNAIRWKLYNKGVDSFSKKNTKKILLIRYEDLITNYNKEIDKIKQFLGISLETVIHDNIIQQKINIEDYIILDKFKERFVKKYSDLNKELNSDRLNVWKDKLTEKEIKLADAICSKNGKKYGYNEYYKLNVINSFFLKLKHIIPIIKGYIDVYKDKLIYFAPIEMKLNRLKKRYTQLGFIKK